MGLLLKGDGTKVKPATPLETILGSIVHDVVIANGASLSSAIYKPGQSMIAIQAPAAFDAGVLTFQGSIDGSTYVEIEDANGITLQATSLGASKGKSLGQFALDLAPWPYLKIRTGTVASPVVQSAARTLEVGTS